MTGPRRSTSRSRVWRAGFPASPGVVASSDSSEKSNPADPRQRPVPGRVMISMRGPSPLPSARSGVGSMMICAISSGRGRRPSSKPSMMKPDTSSARSPDESAPASSSR